MDTAAETASAADTGEERAGTLAELSEAYACLGQVELADAIAQETLPFIEQIEAAAVKGDLLVTLAAAYGEHIGDTARMDELLVDAIALAEMLSQDSSRQSSLVGDIVRLYSRAGDYR